MIEQQRKIIVTSALIVLAVGFITSIKKNGSLPSARFFVGLGFAFAIMSLLADLGTPFGGPLALLVLVATLLENGPELFGFVDTQVGTGVGQAVGIQFERTGSAGGKLGGALAPQDPGFQPGIGNTPQSHGHRAVGSRRRR